MAHAVLVPVDPPVVVIDLATAAAVARPFRRWVVEEARRASVKVPPAIEAVMVAFDDAAVQYARRRADRPVEWSGDVTRGQESSSFAVSDDGPDDRLVDVTVAAERVGVSVSTLRRMTRDGRVPCHRIGRSVRYRLDDLKEFARAPHS